MNAASGTESPRQVIEEEVEKVLEASRRANIPLLREQLADANKGTLFFPGEVCLVIGELLGLDRQRMRTFAGSLAWLAVCGDLLRHVAVVAESNEAPAGIVSRVGMPLSLNVGDALFSYAETAIVGTGAHHADPALAESALEILDNTSLDLAEALRRELRGEEGAARMSVLSMAAGRLAGILAGPAAQSALARYGEALAGIKAGAEDTTRADQAITSLLADGLSPGVAAALGEFARNVARGAA